VSDPKHVVEQQAKVVVKFDALINWEEEACLDMDGHHKNCVDH